MLLEYQMRKILTVGTLANHGFLNRLYNKSMWSLEIYLKHTVILIKEWSIITDSGKGGRWNYIKYIFSPPPQTKIVVPPPFAYCCSGILLATPIFRELPFNTGGGGVSGKLGEWIILGPRRGGWFFSQTLGGGVEILFIPHKHF